MGSKRDRKHRRRRQRLRAELRANERRIGEVLDVLGEVRENARARVGVMRAAIVRLLWNSIADDAECTCEGLARADACPECQAMIALGFGPWPGAEIAAEMLVRAT